MNALMIIAGLAIVTLVAEFANLRRWLLPFVILGLGVAGLVVYLDRGTDSALFNNMVLFDTTAQAFTGLIILISLLWFWMASSYFSAEDLRTDRMSLALFVVAGAVIMCSFGNMAMLFLGIEILSVSLYVLAGSRSSSFSSTEAAFKYFLMGSFATGFLLFGIALVYGATGSFHILTIGQVVGSHELPGFFYVGVMLMLVGLAFKLSAVPFHFWAPDVYEGSPTVVTAFMSTVVKIAAVAAFFRIFTLCFGDVQGTWGGALQVMIVLTLIVPNITAVYQSNVKRMLAYSSVGHVGYLLLALIAGTPRSGSIMFYYLTAYSFASISAFTVLHILEAETGNTKSDGFKGLFKSKPLLAVVMAIALMSLAGIPPLPGFFGKYMVFALAIEQGYTSFVILAIVMSLVSVYYYFRIIVAMFFEEGQLALPATGLSERVLLILLVGLVLLSGLLPDLIALWEVPAVAQI